MRITWLNVHCSNGAGGTPPARNDPVNFPHIDELSRQASHVRLLELRHLVRCERGLAAAYRDARGVAGVPDRRLAELERHHLEHAELLLARIDALGGRRDEDVEDLWVTGDDARHFAIAEHASLATYHDHLLDLDAETAEVVRNRIIPEHAAALALLQPGWSRDRDGDL
jgi:hypothetical protein